MIIVNILKIVNIAFSALFMICYSYQVLFLILSLFQKPKKYGDTDKSKKYAIITSARNEEDVIGQLCACIKNQDYPSDKIDLFVVADNCTDGTADVARENGAIVYERNNEELPGKGHALGELFAHIKNTVGYDTYDAYIIVDADNILEPNYVSEMDKCFSDGGRIIVGYRNSKNFGTNWITAGYGLWFMREARQLNIVRTNLKTTCDVKGTGFLVSSDIIKRQDGWIHKLLIEDIQFTVENVLSGEKVVYCHDAVLYDEQPTSFKDSWWQRTRWCRGYMQILKRYSGRLLGGFVKGLFKGRGFSRFDLWMSMSPAFFITLAMLAINVVGFIALAIVDASLLPGALWTVVPSAIGAYALFWLVGLLTAIYEWDRIKIPNVKKILYTFTFPVFMATYVPIAAFALFVRAKWKPIQHHPVSEEELDAVKGEDGKKNEK